ncbi:general substrate transporter [Lipomyces arxii]|uniref:general substrate transporter n=1 Tax=Lipomyces arxii TaxID=56418 RepID=UPI0034CF4656
MSQQGAVQRLLSDQVELSESIQEPQTVYNRSRFEGLVLQDVIPQHKRVWYEYPHLVRLNFFLCSAILTNITAGFDGSLLNGLQSLPAWNQYFSYPEGGRLGTLSNAIIFGELISIPLVPYICEKYGRRKPIVWGCMIVVVGALFQGLALNYFMFALARFILGFGLAMSGAATPLFVVECAYPTQRGQMTSLILPAWNVGSFFAAIITYSTFHLSNTNLSWRIPSILQGFFPILQSIVMMYAPESPRWLVSQNRHDEAFSFLVNFHSDGDQDSELVNFELAEITAAIEMEKVAKQSRWGVFFETQGMQHRLLIIVFLGILVQFSGNSMLSYYLPIVLTNMGIADAGKQLLINLGSTVLCITTGMTSGLQIERIGRRSGFLVALFMMTVMYCILTWLSASNEQVDVRDVGLAYVTVGVVYIFQIFYHLMAPFAVTYMVEIVPFSMRSKATTLNHMLQHLTLLFDNFINPLALNAWRWKFYLFYCFVLAGETLVIYNFFPETGGKGLEEIAVIFDDVMSTIPLQHEQYPEILGDINDFPTISVSRQENPRNSSSV